jgi:uncharacterized protein (DUF2062 family)
MRRFWSQRVTEPLKSLLRQGLTAEGLALALALGVATGLFPVIGTTTVLGLAAAGALRLNLPALQLANWMAYPAQIALIVPLVRLGEWLAGVPPVSFSVTHVVARTMADPLDALAHYGMTGVHGILGWLAIVPILVLVLYWILLPVLRGVQVRGSETP